MRVRRRAASSDNIICRRSTRDSHYEYVRDGVDLTHTLETNINRQFVTDRNKFQKV